MVVQLVSHNHDDYLSRRYNYLFRTIPEQSDYIPVVNVLTFGTHDSNISFSISLIDDDALEDVEVFHVLLSSPDTETNSINFESSNASVIIIDQDCKLTALILLV